MNRAIRILRFAVANGPMPETWELLEQLPADLDPSIVASTLVALLDRDVGGDVYDHLHALPGAVIEALLAHPALPRDHFEVRFLESLTRGGGTTTRLERWRTGLEILERLQARPLRSHALRRGLAHATSQPAVVEALREAVIRGLERPCLVAVLAVDGSEASAAALAAHLAHGDLGAIESVLKVAADTPAMAALARDLGIASAQRTSRSPAMELARLLDLDVPALELRANLRADDPDVRCHVAVSTRFALFPRQAFSVSCQHGARTTAFDDQAISRDELEVGGCTITGLPGWLAHVADRLNVSLTLAPGVMTNLRGAHRRRLLDWLQSRGVSRS